MSQVDDLIKQIRTKFPKNKTGSILLLIVSVLLVFGLFRACSGNGSEFERRVYRIARDDTWYPLNLMGKEKDMLGFTSDLILAVADRSRFSVQIRNAGSNTLFQGLQKNNYDAVISSLMATSQSMTTYTFSDALYPLGPVLIVAADETETSLEDLGNKIVGVSRGSNIVFDVAQYQVHFASYDSISVAFDDLIKGNIDAVLLPDIQAYTYVNALYPGKLKVVSSPLSPEALRLVALRTPHTAFLIEKFNSGLAELKEDGTYDLLLKKWGLVNPVLPKDR